MAAKIGTVPRERLPFVRLAAVGDLLLAPVGVRSPYRRAAALVSPPVRRLFAESDLVFGNLECTLAGDDGCVPTEPRVLATEDWVRAVGAAGFDLVTLANNHAFDGFESGFLTLRRLLETLPLPHFGAGMNLGEATAPAVVERGGLRLALLAAVDESTGPYCFAADGQPGVAPLDVGRLTAQIAALRAEVDHVIVSLHWGEERFAIPSPAQVEQARRLVDAGASMVIGHHPHVLQGLEYWRGAPIAYSLGNFFADEVPFSDGDAVRWNRTERTGAVLLAELTADAVRNVRLVPTFDAGVAVELDESGFGTRHLARLNQALARGVTAGRYRREHFRVNTLRPALARLRWSRLRKLRPRHLRTALARVLAAVRTR